VGAKERDYPWTVLAVDPVALPLTRLLARTKALSPNQVTALSLTIALPIGALYATTERWGLVAGGILYYLSFVLDCVDGKLARTLRTSSKRGELLEQMADEGRRLSAALGLIAYLYRSDGGAIIWLPILYGFLAAYFMAVSGGERKEPRSAVGGRISGALARRRLLPTIGMPDVSAIVYVIGPIAGVVVPCLWVGLVLICLAILKVLWRLRRR
jgi:phosphatidylglycerophosphate synthase